MNLRHDSFFLTSLMLDFSRIKGVEVWICNGGGAFLSDVTNTMECADGDACRHIVKALKKMMPYIDQTTEDGDYWRVNGPDEKRTISNLVQCEIEKYSLPAVSELTYHFYGE